MRTKSKQNHRRSKVSFHFILMGLIVTLQYIVEVLTRGSKKAAIPKSEIDMFADCFPLI